MPKRTKTVKITDQRGNKPWLKVVGVTKYKIETKEKNKTFLIVTEGQTEELYFKSFPVITATIKPVPLGCSKTTLVSCTKAIVADEKYDEVWCVFDMDIKHDDAGQLEDFNNAVQSALDAGFKCAYSNDAFELWFILHYQYLDQEHNRIFFFEKLREFWKINYVKQGKTIVFAKTIYSILQNDPRSSQAKAITNARKLFRSQKHKSYHLQNPVTLVYKLVEELNKHLRQ